MHKMDPTVKKIRRTTRIEPKNFFQFLICNDNYTYIREVNEHIENLFVMTGNRKKGDIFLVSSKHFSIVVAKDCRFSVIPISKFLSSIKDDFQLNLVENYLLKLRYTSDMKAKNDIDFGFLTMRNMLAKQPSANSSSFLKQKKSSLRSSLKSSLEKSSQSKFSS